MAEEESVSRISQNWPVDLKGRVKEKVGARGITNFTIAAVEARLEGHDVIGRLQAQRDEARELAEAAVTRIATMADIDSDQILASLDLPEWIDRSEWPTGGRSPAPEFTPEPEIEAVNLTEAAEAQDSKEPLRNGPRDEEIEARAQHAGIQVEHQEPQSMAERHQDYRDKTFARLREMADESGINLAPASELQPADEADDAVIETRRGEVIELPCGHFFGAEQARNLEVIHCSMCGADHPQSPVAEAGSTSEKTDACPQCFSPLIDGECLACSF